MDENEQSVALGLGVVIALAMRVAWGLIVLFGIIGIVAGYEHGPYVIMISATVFITLRIVFEAVQAVAVLRAIFSQKSNEE